jgi:hypothetical protein
MHDRESIFISIPGSAEDPRSTPPRPPGVVIRSVPQLHPDDVTVVDGVPVTTVARTLIDCAEDVTPEELRAMFENARRRGLLDLDALRASRARVEWRPSLPVVDALIAEFSEDDAPT